MSIALANLFEQHADYDPAKPLDEWLAQVPAKWVVYLFADADDQPVQLLCVKNLRASLKRRLGGDEVVGPTRRVNYRDLIRRVYWRRVDSGFEADVAYLETARQIFPKSYRGMLGFEPAWFVQVNPANNFPRYVKTIDLTRQGVLIGPLPDKHAAARFIELIEDSFDLCRYYNVLIEAPRGRACAYKEMGKCPAPCDGSIEVGQYRELIRWSAETVVAPEKFVAEHRRRMESAAAELNFEAAGKVKQYLDQISQFGQGAFKHARRLEDFRYLSLQHGPKPGMAKVFLVTPGAIGQAGVISDVSGSTELLRHVLAASAGRAADVSEQGVERVGVVADHLFRAKRVSGVFMRLDEVEERGFAKAFKELQKQKGHEESEDEGVVRELQQI